ncbi:MAG: hypothetical protein ACOCW4_02410, partial [bacterium]
ACHQHRTGGGTDSITCLEIGEAHAFPGHAVEVRCMDLLLPLAPQVVSHDKNDVGLSRVGSHLSSVALLSSGGTGNK